MYNKLFLTLIISAICALGVLAIPLGTGVKQAPRDAASSAFLKAHNSARASYGARPLTWSSALLPVTIQWAAQCNFAHSQSDGRYGENLYASSDPNGALTDAVTAWMSEAAQYNYNRPGFSFATGHFTQVVWMSTTQVACVRSVCPAGTIFSTPYYTVCRYSPPGNYQGRFPQNVGRRVA